MPGIWSREEWTKRYPSSKAQTTYTAQTTVDDKSNDTSSARANNTSHFKNVTADDTDMNLDSEYDADAESPAPSPTLGTTPSICHSRLSIVSGFQRAQGSQTRGPSIRSSAQDSDDTEMNDSDTMSGHPNGEEEVVESGDGTPEATEEWDEDEEDEEEEDPSANPTALHSYPTQLHSMSTAGLSIGDLIKAASEVSQQESEFTGVRYQTLDDLARLAALAE